jgi:hypothetical protein
MTLSRFTLVYFINNSCTLDKRLLKAITSACIKVLSTIYDFVILKFLKLQKCVFYGVGSDEMAQGCLK